MSDDISIPRVSPRPGAAPAGSFTHSYRARRTGMDASTRRLFMAASALGMLLLAGMGVWTFGGHRAAGVPVIEADTRPLRVKPDNPGGMTVAGANDQVMGGRGDGEPGDLAPEAERPDPQALRAQRAAPAAPPTPAPQAAPQAVPVASAPAPAIPAPAAKPPVAAPPAPASAGPMVQLAALETEQGATAEWQRLAHKAPELLGDRKPNVVRVERDGKTFWRLRTGGFTDLAAATEFCRKVRAKGLGCTISS